MKSAIVVLSLLLLNASSGLSYIGGKRASSNSIVLIQPLIGFSCTGVKVAENIFLTAAHCTRVGVSKGTQITLTTNIDSKNSVQIKTTVKSVSIHPLLEGRYLDKSYSDAPDLALISVENSTGIKPMPICLNPLKKDDEIIVGGFGNKGEGVPGFNYYTVATKRIQETRDSYLVMGLQNADYDLSFAADGDSGGPAMMRSSNGELSVIGINSAGSVSSQYFNVNPETGKLTGSKIGDPVFFVVRLGYESNEHNFETDSWLKKNIPAISVTNCKKRN